MLKYVSASGKRDVKKETGYWVIMVLVKGFCENYGELSDLLKAENFLLIQRHINCTSEILLCGVKVRNL
jgi:hypothetical protein